MQEKCQEFITTLVNQSEELKAAYIETIKYWEPDEPPITTLFAALGRRIVEEFDKIDSVTNQRTFQLVESAMASGDCNLETAVATGLIEAVVGKAYLKEGMWQQISPMLGELSRSHAEAWIG